MADPGERIRRLVFDSDVEEIPDYDSLEHFTMKVYHAGYIHPKLNKYVMGKISYYDNVNKDKISLIEIDDIVKGIDPTYVGTRIDYWYSIGSEADAMTRLQNDADALMMWCCVPHIRLVILYLDHRELDPDYNKELDAWNIGRDPLFSQQGSSNVVIEEIPDSPKKARPLSPRKILTLTWQNQQSDKHTGGERLNKGKGKMQIQEEAYEDTGGKSEAYGMEDGWISEVEESDNDGGEDDGSLLGSDEDDDYDPAKEDEEYAGYGVDDDFLFDWLCEDELQTGEGGEVAGSVVTKGPVVDESGSEDIEEMDGAVNSDEELIGHEAESEDIDEGSFPRFPEFNPNVDMKHPKFCNGMVFGCVKMLREAVLRWPF